MQIVEEKIFACSTYLWAFPFYLEFSERTQVMLVQIKITRQLYTPLYQGGEGTKKKRGGQ